MEQEGSRVFNVHLSVRNGDGYVKVALRGELDIADASDVAEALIAAVSREPRVIVDLSELTFIDASGVSALLLAREQARNAGGDLYLCAPQSQALKVLGVLRHVDAFSVHASVAEAAARAGRSLGMVPPMRRSPQTPA
jgi:anti-anti-sigma factor